MINKLTELLNEADESPLRPLTNIEKADFLMLNGTIVPPIRVGTLVKNKKSEEYIVDEFSHKIERLSSGVIVSSTLITVIHAEDKDSSVFAAYPYTVDDFLREFSI